GSRVPARCLQGPSSIRRSTTPTSVGDAPAMRATIEPENGPASVNGHVASPPGSRRATRPPNAPAHATGRTVGPDASSSGIASERPLGADRMMNASTMVPLTDASPRGPLYRPPANPRGRFSGNRVGVSEPARGAATTILAGP